MTKIKLLFIMSNIDIGGPQKSLLSLLDVIDYDKFDVSVCVLEPGGLLEGYYNKNVKFVKADDLVTAATIPSKRTLQHLKVFVAKRKLSMCLGAIGAILRHLIFKKNMNQERQRFWSKYAHYLPGLEGQFDLGFGILGLSTYFLVDCVNATKKYHWIRSDIRILNRVIDIDASYFRRVDGCLSVSSKCADIFEDIYPFMKGKIDVFYNYIPVSLYESLEYDESHMKLADESVKIVTVTRLDPLKGIELAIDACEILVSQGYKIRWFILGDGESRTQIQKMVEEKGVQESFVLLGFQINTLSFIKDADIFVHPSRTEGKSNAVDEAKFCGKPIVVTNYDTVEEQVEDNVTGIVCEMNGAAIATSIEKLITSIELRNKLSDNCIKCEGRIRDATQFFEELHMRGEPDGIKDVSK